MYKLVYEMVMVVRQDVLVVVVLVRARVAQTRFVILIGV